MALILTRVIGFGGLLDALVEEVRSWRKPIPEGHGYPGGWVALPTRPLVHALRDSLSGQDGGALNVRIGSLGSLGLELGGPGPIHRPVPRGAWEAFLEEELSKETSSPLFPVLELPGLSAALGVTFDELRMTGASGFSGHSDDLFKRFDAPRKIKALGALLEAWSGFIEENGFHDRAALFRAAIETLRLDSNVPGRLQADRILVVLDMDPSPLEEDLLLALAQSKVQVDAWATQAPGAPVDALAETSDRLAGKADSVCKLDLPSLSGLNPFLPPSRPGSPARAPSVTPQAVSCPGPESEAREIARACIRFAEESIPFAEMAVLMRHPSEELPLIVSALERAGLPCNFRGGDLLSFVPEAACLLRLLDAVADGYHRDDLFRAMRMIPLDGSVWNTEESPIPVNEWDRITRESCVISGREGFLERLDQLVEEIVEEIAHPERGTRVEDLKNHLPRVRACRIGIARLFEAIEDMLEAPDWSSLSRRMSAFLRRLVVETPGLGFVLNLLKSLPEFDETGSPDSPETVARTVRDLFESGGFSVGMTGRSGVNVLPLFQATGLDFRSVIVSGTVLRRFPPPPREDPFLLDEERIELARSGLLKGFRPRIARLGEEARAFAAAVAGARERIFITFSGFDPASGRAQTPSPFVLRLFEANLGKALDIESLLKNHVRIVPVFTGANEGAPPDTPFSWDRSVLEDLTRKGRWAYLKAVSPNFTRALTRREALTDLTALSEYDGWLRKGFALEHVRQRFGKKSRFSPTALEHYARCPYSYFLQRIVGLEALPDPVLVSHEEEIDPMHKGTVVHEILEKFNEWRIAKRANGAEPSQGDCKIQLNQIAKQVFEREIKDGNVGSLAVWAGESKLLHEEMWSAVLSDLLDGTDFKPLEAEPKLRACIQLPGKDGAEMEVYGYADRVDRSEDGKAVRVVDYKVTRGKVKKKDDSFMGGQALQLPLYVLMALAREEGGNPERCSGVYHFLSRAEGFRRVFFSGSEWKAREKALKLILRTIYDGVRAGLFIPNPGEWDKRWKSYSNCSYCDFDSICGSRRDRMIEILKAPPGSHNELDAFRKMTGMETVGQGP